MKSRRTWFRVSLAVAVVAAVVAGAFVILRLRGGSLASQPNIVLITFDTTRADRIGAYGWRQARTPTIDGLAENGILFQHASAPVPLTLPSHTGMMTGLYPFYNGVRDNSTFCVSEAAKTLAERLSDRGYQTGAVVAAFVLDSRFGLDQGFDEYRDELPDKQEFARFQIPERNAQKIVDDAMDWIDSTSQDSPFFLWSHFYDPHHPYRTPTSFPFFVSHPYDLEVAFADYHLRRLLDHVAANDNGRPTVIVFAGDHGEGFGENGEETHGFFVYDSTIRVPLIIQLPDGLHAGSQVDMPVSLVDIMPTILELAGVPPLPENEVHGRSLVSLFSGDPQSAEKYRQRPIYFECYSPMYNFGFAPVRGVRVDQMKLIDSPEPELYVLSEDPREGIARSVYQQRPEIADSMSEALEDLLDLELSLPPYSGEAQALDAEMVQKLRSLGYLATEAAEEREWGPADDLKRMLPLYNRIQAASETIGAGNIAGGTKSLVDILSRYPDNPRALWYLAEVVATDPVEAAEGLPVLEAAANNEQLDLEMRVPFLVNCGRAYLIMKDPVRALTYFEEAIEAQPDNSAHLMWICSAYLTQGRNDKALEVALRAFELAPEAFNTQAVLGLAYFCQGKIQQGAEVWDKLLSAQTRQDAVWEVATMCAKDPSIAVRLIGPFSLAAGSPDASPLVRAALHATNGQILMNGGQFETALKALEAACGLLEADSVSGHWWRARALIYLQRPEEAVRHLEKAYALAPEDIRVVADLAMTKYQLGQIDQAVELLSTYQEINPEDPTAANNLAWILSEHAASEDELDRALELAKFAVMMRKSSSSFHDTLACVHLKRGDGESAISAVTTAVRRNPKNPEYRYHLALAYQLDGQLDRAREEFQTAVELAPTPRPSWFEDAQAVLQEKTTAPDDSGDDAPVAVDAGPVDAGDKSAADDSPDEAHRE